MDVTIDKTIPSPFVETSDGSVEIAEPPTLLRGDLAVRLAPDVYERCVGLGLKPDHADVGTLWRLADLLESIEAELLSRMFQEKRLRFSHFIANPDTDPPFSGSRSFDLVAEFERTEEDGRWVVIRSATADDEERKTEPAAEHLVHAYTRRHALADGVLVDVTALAREAGFRVPVAVTAAVQALYVEVPPGVSGQDEVGRLWGLLNVLWFAVQTRDGDGNEVRLRLGVRNRERGELETVELKAVCGPDDDGAPCLTVMLSEED